MHKLKIKFSPYDEDSKQELMASGCKPLLDLSLKASKSWDSVVEHLEKKWTGVKQLRLRIRVFYQTATGQTGLNMCAAAQLSKSIFESVQNHPSYTPLDPAAASVEVPVFAYLYSLRPMAAIEALSSAASSKSKAKAKAKPSAKASAKAADSASTVVAAPPSTSRKQKGRAAQTTITATTTTTTTTAAAAASISTCATPSLPQQLASQPQTNGCSHQHSEDSLAPLWLLAESESSHLLGPLAPHTQNQTQNQTQIRHSARLAPAATASPGVDGPAVIGDFGGNFFGACSLLAPPPLTAGIAGAGAGAGTGTRARSGSFGGGAGGGHGLELSLLLPPPVPTARRAGTRSVRRDPALEPEAPAAQAQAQALASYSTVATRSSLLSQPQPPPPPQPQSLFGYIIQEGAPQAQTKLTPAPTEDTSAAAAAAAAAAATPTNGLKRKTSPVTAAAKENNNKLGSRGNASAAAAAAAAADSTQLTGPPTKKLTTAAPAPTIATAFIPRPSPSSSAPASAPVHAPVPVPATIPVPTPVSASAAAVFASTQRAQPATGDTSTLAPPLTNAPDFSRVRLPRMGPKRHLRRITPTFLSSLPLPYPMMTGPGQV